MPPGYSWQDLIRKAFESGVDLTARQRAFIPGSTRFGYFSYGAACAETLIDVLTGETQVSRVDILYDCGQR
jgi:xanthine dehydrogenase/oxidase